MLSVRKTGKEDDLICSADLLRFAPWKAEKVSKSLGEIAVDIRKLRH